MPQLREVLRHVDHQPTKAEVPSRDVPQTPTREYFPERPGVVADNRSNSPRHQCRGAIRMVENPETPSGSRIPGKPSHVEFGKESRRTVVEGSRASTNKRLQVVVHGSQSGGCLRKLDEPFDAQVRRFQDRDDLRECLLPGMLGRISPRACEGWKREAVVRNSRSMSKIKLEPCKRCRFGISLQ